MSPPTQELEAFVARIAQMEAEAGRPASSGQPTGAASSVDGRGAAVTMR